MHVWRLMNDYCLWIMPLFQRLVSRFLSFHFCRVLSFFSGFLAVAGSLFLPMDVRGLIINDLIWLIWFKASLRLTEHDIAIHCSQRDSFHLAAECSHPCVLDSAVNTAKWCSSSDLQNGSDYHSAFCWRASSDSARPLNSVNCRVRVILLECWF